MSTAAKPTSTHAAPHPLAGQHDDRCRHDRAGARRRGRRHDLRLQRRRDPADLRRRSSATTRATRERGDPPRSCRRPSRARASWRRATRARAGGSACSLVTSGPGRHQLGDADPRLPGRLGAGRAHLRPGAARRDGHRRVPGSAGLQHHGGLRQARLPRHRRDARSRRRCARAFDIARSGRPGPVVVDIPRDVQLAQGVFQGAGLLPLRGYRRARSRRSSARRISAADARGVLHACSARRSGR